MLPPKGDAGEANRNIQIELLQSNLKSFLLRGLMRVRANKYRNDRQLNILVRKQGNVGLKQAFAISEIYSLGGSIFGRFSLSENNGRDSILVFFHKRRMFQEWSQPNKGFVQVFNVSPTR